MACDFIYYDKNGNHSKVYYDTLEKEGEKAALDAYLYEMLTQDTLFKYELEGNRDSKSILKKLDEHNKITYDELEHSGFTRFSNLSDSKSKSDRYIEAMMAINLKTTELMETEGYEGLTWIQVRNEVKDNYFKFNIADATSGHEDPRRREEFEHYLKDSQSLRNFYLNSGTGIHKLLEIIINNKNEGDYEGLDGFNTYYNLSVQQYLDQIENIDQSLNKTMLEGLRPVIRDLIKDINQLEKNTNTKLIARTEQHIFSNKVTVNGKPVQGTSDLLLYDPKNNVGYLYDFKTRSAQAYKNVDNPHNPYMDPPFESIINNSHNKLRIQLGLYKKIYEVEYGIKILDTKVFNIVSNIESEGDVGNKKWHLSSVIGIDSGIQSIVPFNVGDVSDTAAKPKLKNVNTLMDELFDSKLVTVTQSERSFVYSQEKKIKESGGSFQWRDFFGGKWIKTKTKEDMILEIKKSYKNYIAAKKKAAPHLVDYFNTGTPHRETMWALESFQNKANHILQPFSTSEYEILTSRELEELSKIGDDVLIVRNKLSNEVILISLAASMNNTITFHEKGDAQSRTTILGPYMTDDAVKKKYGLENVPKATTHTLSKLRLALIAGELRTIDPEKYNNITKIMSVTLQGKENNYDSVPLDEELGVLQMLQNAMKESGTEVPLEILNALKLPATGTVSNSVEDKILDQFFQDVMSGTDPLTRLALNNRKVNKRKVEYIVNDLKKYAAERDRAKWDMSYYINLKKAFDKYYTTAYTSVMAAEGIVDKETVYRNHTFVTINKAFLAFNDLFVLENPSFKKSVLRNLNSLTTLNDPLAEKLHLAVQKYLLQARTELTDPIEEHIRLQKALVKATPGVNTVSRLFSKDVSKKVFGPMMEDGFSFDEKDVDIWMKFKDPDKRPGDNSYLTKEQRDYIRFFVKESKKALLRMYPSKTNEDLLYGKDSKGKWNELYVPVIPKSATDVFRDTMIAKKNINFSAKDVFDAGIKALKSLRKKSLAGTEQAAAPYTFASFFVRQVDTLPGRGSADTRNLLRITEDDEKIDDERNVETNPITVLNMMMIEASRKEHMQMATLASMAVDADLAYKAEWGGVETQVLRGIIQDITQQQIHNKVDNEEGILASTVDLVRKGSSLAAFWGSVRQIFTETSTATFQNLAQMVANGINKYVFKGDNLFDNKDRLWAAKEILTPFGEEVMRGLGMYNSSLGQFTDSKYNEMQKKFMLQTKHGFWMIHKVLQQNFEGVVLAQMHKQGLDKSIYDYDKETGVYTYNETLDPRFYVYDPELKIEGQQSKEPEKGTENYEKWLKWKFYRREMIKERGIHPKTNKMLRPFTNTELQWMKQYSVQLFGPMDSSEVMAAEASAMGRAGSAWKRWIFRKAHNWKNAGSKTIANLEIVGIKDANGDLVDYDYRNNDFKGYIDTLFNLVEEIKQQGSLIKGVRALADYQKRNLSRLIALTIMYMILGYLALEAGKIAAEKAKEAYKEAKKMGGQAVVQLAATTSHLILDEMKKGILNGIGDMLPLLAFDGLISGSAFATFSYAKNGLMNTAKAMMYGISGDLDLSLKWGDKAFDSISFYRSMKGVYQLTTN